MRLARKILLICGIIFAQNLFAESLESNRDSRVDSANSTIALESQNPAESLDSTILESPFVFNTDSILNPKAIAFFHATSRELREKTRVNLYVFAANDLESQDYARFREDFRAKLSTPFAAIILIKNAKKIDIIASADEVLTPTERKKIYWEYMVPLLPQKEREITDSALSAVVFNGYVEAVDLIAEHFGVSVNHNVAKNEKGAKAVAKGILYIMLISMLGILALIYFYKGRKNEKI